MIRKSLSRQQGLSLIELLLALVIGLLISSTFLQLMLNSSRSTYFQEDLSLAQENGRHTLYLLGRAMRQAGYSNEVNSLVLPFFAGRCGSAAQCTLDGGGTNSDQVAVQFLPQNGEDCAGNSVPAGELTADVYYVAPDPANGNIDTLFCRGYNPANSLARGAARAVIIGVERLQAVYGVTHNDTDNVHQYLAASAVSDWQDVRSVRLGVLVNSGQQARSFDRRTRSYNILESGTLTLNDGRPRYVFTTAYKLNNAGL
ncbi:PilW family protein [Endozoicomonas sp. 8E]|uniref:PilW family protein n=1 Tax=Endozoicomonas sp. 8E TaxID=3035692 RepID=UPI00293911B9|nr:PilW family protein [Endozoicomonas sp. 8E]WOG26417.1 PilW family protein [Endozoicomonas sp. 8E]